MIVNKNQIYILDDEEGVRRSLETILSAQGYDVKAFGCGSDLLKHMQQMTFTAPAVGLVDLRLPDISGITAMQKIKERCADTEVVMLTGNPDMTSAMEAVNAGAYAYLLKPYNMDEVNHILSKIFEKQKLVRENQEMTQKMKQWNEKLEDEIYQRTLALQDSYRKLQSLYEMRTQFITIMSHELRTPATALMGFADTLNERWKSLPEEKIKEYLGIISRESGRMVLLMSEIFEISKIQEGKLSLDLQEVDVIPLLGKVVHEFRMNYPAFSFGYTDHKEPVPVKLDPLYFKTAISHILLNAVKYTPADGHILIFTEKQGGHFTIRIEDDGPGVSEAMKEKVFEPFFRSMDDVNRKTPGAGLGLTIARGIFSGMSGVVSLRDKISGKKGCSVSVAFPVSSGGNGADAGGGKA